MDPGTQFFVGVAWGAYGGRLITEVAEMARGDGFAHIDVPSSTAGPLALPVADRFSKYPKAFCSSGPPSAGTWSFAHTVDRYRSVPSARLEPWFGSVIGSTEAALEIVAAVPGLRLLLDVGHVVAWGGDPLDLVAHADHVQLRQAKMGEPQALSGTVDYRRVLEALREVGYAGALTIEYVDMPEIGFGLSGDPRAAAISAAAEVTGILGEMKWRP